MVLLHVRRFWKHRHLPSPFDLRTYPSSPLTSLATRWAHSILEFCYCLPRHLHQPVIGYIPAHWPNQRRLLNGVIDSSTQWNSGGEVRVGAAPPGYIRDGCPQTFGALDRQQVRPTSRALLRATLTPVLAEVVTFVICWKL